MDVWRSREVDAQAVTVFSLKNFFDTPHQSMRAYMGDDSGINPKPHPNSNVAHNNRYYFQNRRHIVGFFNGSGLRNLGNRFADLLTERITEVEVGDGWTKHTDLYGFIQRLLIGPAIEAMCGPVLLQHNPAFGEDLWKLDSDILYFFKAYPTWLVPRAYRNRAKLLRNVKNWHAYARNNFDNFCVEADGHDRFYGSPLIRSRQGYLSKVDSLDADALASQDLGLLWAETANSIPAVFWMIYEALKSPSLVSQALAEIQAAQSQSFPPGKSTIDTEVLCTMPILQSMYAESLRLYTSLFSMRSAIHGDFKLGGYTVPKNELIGVDSRVSAMDKDTWNTGDTIADSKGPHPLDEFWAERFVQYPNNPDSGPLRPNPERRQTSSTANAETPSGHDGRFTTEGLAGAWTPYGGGSRQCPGRNFAKQEIIVAFALVLSMLELELVGKQDHSSVRPDIKYYALGTLPPKGKIPFRMRRKQ